jgi:hypothetical protein
VAIAGVFCDVERPIKDRDKKGRPIGQQQRLSPSFYKRMLTMAVATSTGSGLAIVRQESTPQFESHPLVSALATEALH